MTNNDKKVKLLNLQLLATIGFIVALFISFTLTYDKKMNLTNSKRIYDDKTAQNLALMQTILVFLVALLFLYITYNQYKISKMQHEEDEKDLFLQSETALLSVIAACVGLYIVFKNYRKNSLSIAEIESI